MPSATSAMVLPPTRAQISRCRSLIAGPARPRCTTAVRATASTTSRGPATSTCHSPPSIAAQADSQPRSSTFATPANAAAPTVPSTNRHGCRCSGGGGASPCATIREYQGSNTSQACQTSRYSAAVAMPRSAPPAVQCAGSQPTALPTRPGSRSKRASPSAPSIEASASDRMVPSAASTTRRGGCGGSPSFGTGRRLAQVLTQASRTTDSIPTSPASDSARVGLRAPSALAPTNSSSGSRHSARISAHSWACTSSTLRA